MHNLNIPAARWRTSSRSGGNGNCVEVADNLGSVVALRDSKNPTGPILMFVPNAWSAFVDGVKNGKIGLLH